VQEEHNETKQTVVAVEQERDHLRRRVDEQQSQLEYYEQAAQKLHLQISQERATFTTAAQTSNAAHQKQLVETQQALANATRELDQLKASVHRRETTLYVMSPLPCCCIYPSPTLRTQDRPKPVCFAAVPVCCCGRVLAIDGAFKGVGAVAIRDSC